ncbi:hypothetical protein [Rhizomicrobium electricum]|jgi:hypothetical protein|uniref:Uncharacterized protein n=1 Tax=Rhizomicrobium electricum TaxID=480070 RepID=A0ABP3PGT7_9PROT|nr:hypothetical protein [Rhizomicrobium electricum]NIJ48364.1 hypothetical protein [Rhizomicrobium electricum]
MEENRRASLRPWALVVAVLLGPSILVWTVRLTALFAGCTPGPGRCHGMALGAGFRDALGLAWAISTSPLLLMGLALAATLLAFRACRPLLGTLSLLALPILTPMLPIVAVLVSRYDGCAVSTDALGSCQLWGAGMGMSFHNAAIARDVVYSIVPYTFALAVMLGILGFFFARPKAAPAPHPMAQMRHNLGDDLDQ